MKSAIRPILAVLGLAVTAPVFGQYAPPPPARPFPGYLNEYLRKDDIYMSAWDVGVNVRVRFEDKEDAGFTYAGSNADFKSTPGIANDNDNSYYLTRVMPRVGYTDKWWSFLVEARSSASIDDERGDLRVPADAAKPGRALTENDRDANIHQAFVTFGNHKEFPVSAKIGRQELMYGDQRLVGAFKWNNNGRTFDAAKVRYQNSLFGVDLFSGGVVYNDNGNFNESHIGKDSFSGAYFNFPTVSTREVVEAYAYSRNVTKDSAFENWSGVAAPFRNPAKQDLYTVGLRVKSKPGEYGPWDYGVELMHQFGNRALTGPAANAATTAAAVRKEQDAYAAILQGGYTWTEQAWQPRLGLTYSYASGDKNAADGKSGTFQNLFATTHLHYGYMDLNSLQNLHDIRLSYTFKPKPTLSVALEGHLQYLDKTTDSWYNVAGVGRAGGVVNSGTGYAVNPSYGSELGQEVDIIFGWSPTPSTQLELGLGHYFTGDYIEQSLRNTGSSDASYAYFQVTFSL